MPELCCRKGYLLELVKLERAYDRVFFKCPPRRSLRHAMLKVSPAILLGTFLSKGILFPLVPCIHCIFRVRIREKGISERVGKTFP